MWIEMISLESGPDGIFPPGNKRLVSEEKGNDLIAGGYAIKTAAPSAERAIRQPAETATSPTQAEVAAAGSLAAIAAAEVVDSASGLLETSQDDASPVTVQTSVQITPDSPSILGQVVQSVKKAIKKSR